jgi:hypothetical protein
LLLLLLLLLLLQEWTVGPIPTADGVGKETIVRTTTDMQTGGLGHLVF